MPGTIEDGSASRLAGHPRGLAYLAFTEMWERFSYYGMTALLALYMAKQLLLPGHAENVLGLGALRHMFEFRGPMSDQAFASLIYGWYGGLVYFTPILGGWVADRLFGTKATVVLGALLMSGGHIAMSFDQSFLIALGLLILGSGCLKGNISAQVGQLYPRDDESMRTRGFTIFSAGINVGSVLGPLACGGVAAVYGWHAGFALAAALMLVALAVYLIGQRHLPGKRPATSGSGEKLPPLTPNERKTAQALIALTALLILPSIAYPMIWNIGILFIDAKVDLGTPLGAVPASWFNSVDSFASIVAVPPLVALWAWQARRQREPDAIIKMAIGSAIIGVAALILAVGCLLPDADGRVSVIWALICYFGMGVGFLYYWPVMLALISQTAPAKINSTMMGAAFLSLFAGNVLMGWVGSFYEQMSPAAFWAFDGAIGFAGAALMIALRRPIMAALERSSD